MLNLNINIESIELSNELLSSNDKVRISITTLPDNQKHAEIFDSKKLNFIRPSFKIEYKNTIKKLLIVFRKKNYFDGDPIIATAVIYTENLTNIFKEQKNFDTKKVILYESSKNQVRNVVGQIEVNFFITEDLKNSKMNKKNDKKKYRENMKNNSSTKKENEYFLLDNDYVN